MSNKHERAGEPVTGPWTGAVVAPSIPSVIRIPLPGSRGLAIEFIPRPRKGTTSSAIFVQDIEGRRMLRLDYGLNKNTKTFDYHWNQHGTYSDLHVEGHSSAGRAGPAMYKSFKVFGYAGRAVFVVGAMLDVASIVRADNPFRRSTEVISAWAGSWAGAEAAGALGAGIGTAVEPGGGTVVLGVVFAIGGGISGYWAGEKIGAVVYDWGDAHFHQLPLLREGTLP